MVEGTKNAGREKFEKNCGNLKVVGQGALVDQRKIGKRFAICLKKKRRTSKYTSAKCESCAPKDDSSFTWELGVGLMYMMSAGNYEIHRLNKAIDETAKVVQGLKTEIAKKKFHNLYVLSLRAEGNANTELIRGKYSRPKLNKTSTDNTHDSFPSIVEGECGSSVLTEEPRAEVLMDRLEAELESELQKLPWFTTEASGPERSSDFFETPRVQTSYVPMMLSDDKFNKLDGQNCKSYQHIGVMPSELHQKLCYVLLEKQDSQIVELEAELQKSQSKLNEKEAELQTLKDCIRRLTKVSLASASDAETEAHDNDEKKSE